MRANALTIYNKYRKKNMEYTILEAREPEILTTHVNEALQQGWVLRGSLSVINGRDTDIFYYQAMTRD